MFFYDIRIFIARNAFNIMFSVSVHVSELYSTESLLEIIALISLEVLVVVRLEILVVVVTFMLIVVVVVGVVTFVFIKLPVLVFGRYEGLTDDNHLVNKLLFRLAIA